MKPGARILERLKALNKNQAWLAREVGITPPTVSYLVKNGAAGSAHLIKIAAALETTPAYLLYETDDAGRDAIALSPDRLASQLDLVPIESISLEYGLGATFVDGHVEVEIQHFPRAWVESFTPTPSKLLTFARGRGDSMYPTIHSQDMVMIDRSQRRIEEQDAIWAYTWGPTGGIKRLRLHGDKVIVLSDNKAVPQDEIPADEINLVGRVIMIMRSV